MIIGRAQGMAEVAMFSRGGGLVELFNRLVLGGIVPVCQPYFAKGQREQGTVLHGYSQSIAMLTAVGWPALIFLGLASFPLVRIMYGTQWVQAADLAKVLCVAAAFELVHYLAKEALLAAGEAKRANELQMYCQGASVLGLLTVVPFGLWGACWGILAASIAGLILSQHALQRPLGLRWKHLWQSCRASAVVVLVTGVPLGILYVWVPPGEHNYGRWIVVAGVLAATSWAFALRATAHVVWPELVNMVGNISARLPWASAKS